MRVAISFLPPWEPTAVAVLGLVSCVWLPCTNGRLGRRLASPQHCLAFCIVAAPDDLPRTPLRSWLPRLTQVSRDPELKYVLASHEGGATYMAQAYAQVSE